MIRLFANANYDFIKWRRWAYGLTATIIIPGFALFLVHGLNYSIEFTGGTLIQVQTKEAVGTERIRSALDAAGIRDAEIQQFGGPTEYKIQARIAKVGVAEGSTEATAAAVDSALARVWDPGPSTTPSSAPRRSGRRWAASSKARPSWRSFSRSSSPCSTSRSASSGASGSLPCSRRSTTSSPRSRSSAISTSR